MDEAMIVGIASRSHQDSIAPLRSGIGIASLHCYLRDSVAPRQNGIGITSRHHRDSVALHRDSVALFRDGIAPTTTKPARDIVFGGEKRPLPYFYLTFTADCGVQARGTPLGFPHLRWLPLPNKAKPPVRLESLGGMQRPARHEPHHRRAGERPVSALLRKARTGAASAPFVRTVSEAHGLLKTSLQMEGQEANAFMNKHRAQEAFKL